ncbi:glycosyl hydrolase [Dactylosporangium sp. NBC_01737]|uniref:glycosyl hydrolase n=1 Tax=Dactylosporangium sp. NBC_01737 TaxID=2975959 RepID=UPI002E16522F|nr:glycosyl hydrolase [Dactylosporangium sp. NBC_01737]
MKLQRRTLAILVTAATVAALGVLGLTSALAATAGPITGIAGKCVDVAGANSANGTAVQLWTCNGTGAQQWTVESDGSVRALGKCLDVTGASTADGAKVQLYACNGTGAQRWTAGGGRLVNPGSGKCLDASGNSSADGTRLQIWACTGGANQAWKLPSSSASPSPSASQPPTSLPAAKKKGVSTWSFPGLSSAVTNVGAGWYYNWSPSNDSMPAGAEFVPMIWGAASVTDATLAKAKSEGTVLLGFNEPDLAGQANMSVEQALSLWPRLEATGMRLGSPAVAYGGNTPGGWLDRFMTGARQQQRRVDFITLHWYGSDFSAAAAGQFAGYLKAVHDRYNLPIWVTEYGLMNFTGTPKYPSTAQITAFITATTTQMQATSWIERYAWFSLPAVGDSLPYGLYKDGSTPTPAGEAYRAAG